MGRLNSVGGRAFYGAAAIVAATAGSAAKAQLPDPCVSALAALGPDDVLTLEEAATFIEVEPDRLRYAADAGAIDMPGRKILGEWRFSKSALLAWFAGADYPEECLVASDVTGAQRRRAQRLAATAPERVAPTPQAEPMSVQTARAETSQTDQAAGAAANAPKGPPPDQYGDDPDLQTADQIALRADQVVLRKGELTLETNLSYGRGSQGVPVVTPFGVDIVEPTQERYAASLVARYGVLNNLQASFTAPFSLTETSGGSLAGVPDETNRTSENLSLSFNYALAPEGVYRPNIIVSAGANAPVEQGSFGATAGISVLKRFDPAVLLGSVSYTHQFIDDNVPFDEIANRDTITASLGLTLALNDRLSTSGAVIGTFRPRSRFDVDLGAVAGATRIDVPSDQSYALRWAMTALVTEKLYVEPAVSFDIGGLNDDVTFTLSLPYTF